MAFGIPQIGDKYFGAHIGTEVNEIYRDIFLRDITQLPTLMNLLFDNNQGSSANQYYHYQFPNPFSGYYADSVEFHPCHEDAVQGPDTNETFQLDFLNNMPICKGLVLRITFKPISTDVVEESFDYTASVMSIVANSIAAANDNAITWESDGGIVAYLQGLIKIVPKVEIQQRRIWLKKTPSNTVLGYIGSVNKNAMGFVSSDNVGNVFNWPSSTLLLTGLPTIRRWYWDGTKYQWETHIKLAAITLQDRIAPYGTVDYVGWNRLYDVRNGWWDHIILPHSGGYLYPQNDLSLLNYI